MADELSVVITAQGLAAVKNNIPTKNGFKIEITHVDVYAKGKKKGRFAAHGVLSGSDNQITVRSTITSAGEEFHYDEIRLIDGISGVDFAIVKRKNAEVFDFVSALKRSMLVFGLAFSSLPNNQVTIKLLENATMFIELDEHMNSTHAHDDLFNKKVDKVNPQFTDLQNVKNLNTIAHTLLFQYAGSQATGLTGSPDVDGSFDGVGIQIGTRNQRMMLVESGNGLMYRQNDTNNSDFNDENWGAWEKILTDANFRRMFQDFLVPTGTVQYFASERIPKGWLICNGAHISRETYADLFRVIGTRFGAGDGVNTFQLPDLRGEFIRGADLGRGVDRDRVMGSWQEDAIRNITGTLPSFDDTANVDIVTGAFGYQRRGMTCPEHSRFESAVIADLDVSRVVPTADENRPRNVSLVPIIKI